MKLNNIGRIKVTLNLIRENPEGFMNAFMSKVIVLRAELYPNDTIEYIVYNKDLREIKEGEKIPQYYGRFTNGKLLEFEELEDWS